MKTRKAFTLIELLMVIAIIAIISTLAVSKLGGVRERAALQLSIANQKAIERAVSAYLVGGGTLNRLDSLVYAQDGGAPIIGSAEGFDFDTAMTAENMQGVYLGPSADDPDGTLRDQYNSGIMPSLKAVLTRYTLSATEVSALDSRLGLKYVMAHTAYADQDESVYPQTHYPRTRPYGDGTYPNASDGLVANDSACVATMVTNHMVVMAITPYTDLGRTIYQACGQELLNNDVYFGQANGYDKEAVKAEVKATGGPLIAFGLGDTASIIGKSNAGLESAPYSAYALKKHYSRFILLFRVGKAGTGSVSMPVVEFAGVLDCCGNTVRAAEHVLKAM